MRIQAGPRRYQQGACSRVMQTRRRRMGGKGEPGRWIASLRRTIAAILPYVLLAAGAWAQGRAGAPALKLVLTDHELIVTVPTVKPGRVAILIENQTLVINPVLQITSAGGGQPVRLRVPGQRRLRKSWHSTVLTSGTYTLSFEGLPWARATLRVAP